MLTMLVRDLRGCFDLAGYCLAHAPLLAREPYADRFWQKYVDSCRQVIGTLGFRATAIGTVIVIYIIKVAAADASLAMQILVVAVMREGGPLLAALVVLLRVGTLTAAELGAMTLQGDVRLLRQLGLSPRDYLIVPNVFAVALATMTLTFYFQLAAMGGGTLLSALFLDLSLREMLEYLFALLTPADILYTTFKSFTFGLIVATVTSYYGAESGWIEDARFPEAISRSLMQSLLLMMLFNALFAYLVYGILLFGIVKAQI